MNIHDKLEKHKDLIRLIHLLGDIALQKDVMELSLRLGIYRNETEFHNTIKEISISQKDAKRGNSKILFKDKYPGSKYNILRLQRKSIKFITGKSSPLISSLSEQQIKLSIFKAIFLKNLLKQNPHIATTYEILELLKTRNSSISFQKNQGSLYLKQLVKEQNIKLFKEIADIQIKNIKYKNHLIKQTWYSNWYKELSSDSKNAHAYLLKMNTTMKNRNNADALKLHRENIKNNIVKEKFILYNPNINYLKLAEERYEVLDNKQKSNTCKYTFNTLLDKNIYISLIAQDKDNFFAEILIFDTYNNLTISNMLDKIELANWCLRPLLGNNGLHLHIEIFKYQGLLSNEEINKWALKRKNIYNQTNLKSDFKAGRLSISINNMNLELSLDF